VGRKQAQYITLIRSFKTIKTVVKTHIRQLFTMVNNKKFLLQNRFYLRISIKIHLIFKRSVKRRNGGKGF